ncbi:MAG: helix-turn-helix transcriptional regulator [Spirochaetes bacterium]|nr:helix-turn-helix transcriptional regulator [Spirochaetota bacterium]
MDKSFALRLKTLRKQKGFKTREEAAAAIGLSFGTYQRFERGGHPSQKNIKKIVDYYGCSEPWLLTGYGPMYGDHEKDIVDQNTGPPYKVQTKETSRVNDVGTEYSNDIKVSEALMMTAIILESRTPYAAALNANIRAFHNAVEGDERLIQVNERLSALEHECYSIKEENEELNKKVAELQNDLGKLARAG